MTGPTRIGAVYVHAPFCSRRCVYCDFAVTVRREGDLPEWGEAIAAELEGVRRRGEAVLADRLRTLYVGGGTPSLLGPEAMHRLAEVIGPDRLTSPELEWTAEANPESLTREVAARWADAGVNRLSLGAQTFHQESLRWMGRLHGPDGPATAVRHSREAGVDNVSVDLIFGLPRRLGRSWTDDLRRAIDLGTPHVSLYGLTVEERTALGRAVAEGREEPVDPDQYREEYLEAAERLVDAGFVHYEVSNFARPGAEARHNAVYWEGGAYLGLGNGAHSYLPPVRRWNERDWESYRTRALSENSPEAEREVLDDEAMRLERVWLELRTRNGLELAGSAIEALAERWERSGWARREQGRVKLNAEGWLLLDTLSVEAEAAVAEATDSHSA